MKSPTDWPALAPTRGTLFEIPDALGYNPVQLPRYWRFIRATNELSVFYNASVLNVPSVEDVRLLGLRYLVVPTGVEPTVEGRVVEEADGYSLWELAARQPLATVSIQIRFVDDLREAMHAITSEGFDPFEQPVVERPSDVFTCVGDCPPAAAAPTRTISETELSIRLPESAAGILTVRNTYDAGWRAEIDGRPAPTLPVDVFLQGVVVTGADPREVVLTYHDDAVILGLALGAAVWGALLAAPFVALATERRTTRRRPTRSRPVPPAA
jgi:hypothetical protein